MHFPNSTSVGKVESMSWNTLSSLVVFFASQSLLQRTLQHQNGLHIIAASLGVAVIIVGCGSHRTGNNLINLREDTLDDTQRAASSLPCVI